MKWLLFGLLFGINVLFYFLESSFESFSRISLAKFFRNFPFTHKLNYYYVEKYDLVFHSLKTFVFLLQVLLLVFAFSLFNPFFTSPYFCLLVIALAFILLFNTFLYLIGYLKKEFIFKRLFFLFPAVWYLIYPLNRLFSMFLKETRIEEKESEGDDISEEEMEVFFEESSKEGVIDEEDQEMIQSVLEFGDTLVKEVMTPRVDMIHISTDAKVDEIVGIINEHKKSRYPVIANKVDNVEGIILAKDVFDYWKKEDFNISSILRPPFFIPETMRILELLKEMQKSKQQFAIVVDEFGGVSGLVTMEDIVEEIVGDIKDEYDDDSKPILKEKDYYLAKGDTNIYELYEELSIEMDEAEDYQTIAGLISFRLGKIPQVKDTLSFQGWIFEVVEIEKNRIKKVKITREKA